MLSCFLYDNIQMVPSLYGCHFPFSKSIAKNRPLHNFLTRFRHRPKMSTTSVSEFFARSRTVERRGPGLVQSKQSKFPEDKGMQHK